MQLDDILGLLLHDIARPSIDDALHGHSNHCVEGHTIVSPLGFSTDYTGNHAFAKSLLYTFCPSYKDIISDASRHSLKIQAQGGWDVSELNDLSSCDLAFTIYKLMFMRLIDDMSKVPPMLLKKRRDGCEPDYFSSEFIQKMLLKQMITYLKSMVVDGAESIGLVKEMEGKLDAALILLLRAKSYSTHPELYEKHHEIIGPLLAQASIVSVGAI